MLISVIIPNYNHSSFLKKRIESVLNQTYKDFELIILDDKSTDNSREIIETYKNDARISDIIYNNINSGSTFKQWNKGIALAKGKYIWIAESDDSASPDFLATLVEKLKQNPKAVLAYCDSYRIDQHDNVTSTWDYKVPYNKSASFFKSDFSEDGKSFIKEYLLYRNVIPNASAVIFSRESALQIKGAKTKIKYCADWLFWIELLSLGDVEYSALPLNYFRYHSQSVIASSVQNEGELYQKRFDINMRIEYMHILKNNVFDKYISELNKWYLRQDLLEEISFLVTNKKFLEALKLYTKLLFFSDYKVDDIKRLIKHL